VKPPVSKVTIVTECAMRPRTQFARQFPRPKSRTTRPLKAAEVDAMVAGYRSGKLMKDLATEFGIDRRTVSAYLHRAEIPLRQGGLDRGQTVEAVRLYEAGWSSGRLAERFDVSADSVLKSLRRAEVAIRPRRGGPASKGLST
jgi:hypothetical protein